VFSTLQPNFNCIREAWGNNSAESENIPSPYSPPLTAMDSPPSHNVRLSVTQISILNDGEATTVQEMVSASYPSDDASDGEGPGSPERGRLSQNSLPCVVGRLFGMFLAASLVLVPSLTYKSSSVIPHHPLDIVKRLRTS
jgi:hypothetical protein